MIISLIGFMGCGKSHVGSSLNKLIINSHFYDLDNIIEEGENMSISEIFNLKGEEYFRQIEYSYLNNFINKYASTKKHDIIIFSLGGGSLSCDKSIELIKNNSTPIYLKASYEELVKNLEESHKKRPMLKGYNIRERVKELLIKRETTYKNTAKHIIDVDNLKYDEIAKEILKVLKIEESKI